MNKKIIISGICGIAAVGLTGCTAPSRFEWGAYEGSLYTYTKKPEKRATYVRALEQAIAKGHSTDRVAPGLNAELGNLRLQDGDISGAIKLFEEEVHLFPESEPFLRKVISRASEKTKQNDGVN